MNRPETDETKEHHAAEEKVGLLQVLGSVLAAMFGVQSARKRARDFTHGRPGPYIVIGLIMTVLFVLALLGVVRLILFLAGIE